jgi:hypothetical protein
MLDWLPFRKGGFKITCKKIINGFDWVNPEEFTACTVREEVEV